MGGGLGSLSGITSVLLLCVWCVLCVVGEMFLPKPSVWLAGYVHLLVLLVAVLFSAENEKSGDVYVTRFLLTK